MEMPGLWPRDSFGNLEQTVTWVLLHLFCNLKCYVSYSHFIQSKDGISAKWMSKGAYLNGQLTEELYMKQLIGFEVLERFVDLSNPSICWISDVHGCEVFIALKFCETKKKNR